MKINWIYKYINQQRNSGELHLTKEFKTRRDNTNMKEFEKQKDLIERLIEAADENDADYRKAKDFGFVESIKDLILGCYDYKDMCMWLCGHNNDIFYNFSYADIRSQEDFNSMKEFQEAKMDCLMISDDGKYVCMSW